MPLRGRMWYFDYVHYTGAARTFWALCGGGRCGVCGASDDALWQRDAVLCSRVSVSVGVLYACLYALCTRFPRVSCVLG